MLIPFFDLVEAGDSSVDESCVKNCSSGIFLYSKEKNITKLVSKRTRRTQLTFNSSRSLLET